MTEPLARRYDTDQLTPVEAQIREAQIAVEAQGADPRLTRASHHLQKARDAVADQVDGVPLADASLVDEPIRLHG